MLEILYFPLVLFGSIERVEGAEVAALMGLGVRIAGIDAVLARP